MFNKKIKLPSNSFYSPSSWNNRYLINKASLNLEDEAVLFKKYQNGCNKSRNLLILSQQKLVSKIASKLCKNKYSSLQDLIQEGNVAVIEALDNFDPQKGNFATIAAFYIKNKILRKIMQDGSVVSLPESAGKRVAFNKLRQVKIAQNIDELNTDNICKIKTELKISESDIILMNERFKGDFSLNQKISNDDETEWQDLLTDNSNKNLNSYEEKIISTLDKNKYSNKLFYNLKKFTNSNLSKDEKIIVQYRFLNEDKKTLKEMGLILGKSAERVRQLEKQIKEKFKNNFPDYLKLAS